MPGITFGQPSSSVVTTLSLVSNVTPFADYYPSVSTSLRMVTAVGPTQKASLSAHIQQFNVGERIELYVVDATMLRDSNNVPGGLYRFTPMEFSGSDVIWQGNTYVPLACASDGFETNGQTSPATPKLRVSNVGNLFGAVAIEFGDLVGAIVYRYRTFKRFLDGQPDANPTAYFVPDIYTVQRKSTHNKQFVEWELSAGIDQENVFIPARVVLKYTCTQSYRFWDPTLNSGAGDFNYTQATCPFNGSQNGNKYYDDTGTQVTDPSLDLCGRSDADCALRFPGQDLQTWAFPGVGATSVG